MSLMGLCRGAGFKLIEIFGQDEGKWDETFNIKVILKLLKKPSPPQQKQKSQFIVALVDLK